MKQRAVFLIALLATAFFYALWWQSALLEELDNRVYDAFLSETSVPSSRATVIVEIDETSLEALGQWPWPRVVMAQLLTKIASMEPSAIVIDMLFPEPDRTSPAALGAFYRDFFHFDAVVSGLPEALADNDALFAEAIRGTNVTLALFFDSSPSGRRECFLPSATTLSPAQIPEGLYSSPHLLCSLPVLQQAARGAGHIQASPDSDGILRRLALFIRHDDRLIPTLGAAALLSLDPSVDFLQEMPEGDIKATILGRRVMGDDKAQALLRFYPREWYRRVSALEVLNGRADEAFFRGKVVLVGATAMGLHDYHTLSDGTIRPGVYAHATLIENFFDDALLVQPSAYRITAFLLSLLIAVVLMTLMSAKKYLYVLILYSVTVAAAVAAGRLMIGDNVYVSPGYFIIPLTSYLFALAVVLFVLYYREQKRFFEKMSKANEAMIDSMALVAETRDTETGGHIIRTKEYVRLLADHLASRGYFREILTPEYIMNLYHAAPLHDVGKVGISDEILKKNAKLTVGEFEVMKTHTTLGQAIIDNAIHSYTNTTMLEVAYNIARYHHEKWNGSGYPDALAGEQIPLEARMMALADVYDALISRRRYKEPFSYEDAEEIIVQGRGTHFDPVLVDAFVEIKDEFRAIAESVNRQSTS